MYEKVGNKYIKVPKYIVNCKNIDTAIVRGFDWLTKLYNKYGVYENFGQGVYDYIKDNFDIGDSNKTSRYNMEKLQQFFDFIFNIK